MILEQQQQVENWCLTPPGAGGRGSLFKWPPELQDTSIHVKEMVPVVIATALYGKNWRDQLVVFSVDNQAVVDIINKTQQGVSPDASCEATGVLRLPLQLLV